MNSERDKNAKNRHGSPAFLNSLNRGTLATSALAGSFTKAWAAKDEGASAPATVEHHRWKDSRRSARESLLLQRCSLWRTHRGQDAFPSRW